MVLVLLPHASLYVFILRLEDCDFTHISHLSSPTSAGLKLLCLVFWTCETLKLIATGQNGRLDQLHHWGCAATCNSRPLAAIGHQHKRPTKATSKPLQTCQMWPCLKQRIFPANPLVGPSWPPRTHQLGKAAAAYFHDGSAQRFQLKHPRNHGGYLGKTTASYFHDGMVLENLERTERSCAHTDARANLGFSAPLAKLNQLQLHVDLPCHGVKMQQHLSELWKILLLALRRRFIKS